MGKWEWEDNATLVKTLRYGDDKRIGMRALYKDKGLWGYIEYIEVYYGREVWNVIEIGGCVTVNCLSSEFELIEELTVEVIYKLLMEALELEAKWLRTLSNTVRQSTGAIEGRLSQGTVQRRKIEDEFVELLRHTQENQIGREYAATNTAKRIVLLRNKW